MMQKKLTYDEWVEMYGHDPLERAALINQNTELSRRCFTLKCELNRTKRALWLARADRAIAESGALDPWFAQRWLIAEGKCRKYAEKFREIE